MKPLPVLTFCLFLSLFVVLSWSAPVFGEEAATVPKSGPESVILPRTDLKPEPIPHFPAVQYAVIWRTWNLVPLDRLAKTLETTEQKILETAELMGLPEYRKPTWTSAQIYITVLRRNWQLLPYDQLLTLIDQTPDQLAFHLREDDFLFVKLGNRKPAVEKVVFSEPTDSDRARLAEIKQTILDDLGGPLTLDGESPRFRFIEELSETSAEFRTKNGAGTKNESGAKTEPGTKNQPGSAASNATRSAFQLRYIYSYFALFGDPLSDDDAVLYPDGLLEKLAESGVNGVWLHVVLRDLAPGTKAFPELGVGHEKRIRNLQKLVERCKQFGIDVYLYMNEPRAMANSFFERHPNAKGVTEGPFSALCTSDPEVREWLEESLAYLFREVPGLGGIFSISGSENLTYCASHGGQSRCARCKDRPYDDLVVEVNSIMERGVHKSAPDAKVIVWDWGWRGHGRTPEIIARLPKNVWLMSVSEWDQPICRGGVKSKVGEYSISVVGPGPRAKEQWSAAREAGLKTAAKVQLNSTWEMAAVPYVPALYRVAEHVRNLAQSGVDGVMLSWTLGGHPSPNLLVPSYFDVPENAANTANENSAANENSTPSAIPTVDEVLTKLAVRRFGPDAAALALQGWKKCSDAYGEYPYHISVAYTGPQQMGAANLFRMNPTRYPATMVGIPYDDYNSWRGPYPAPIFADQFEKTARGFADGAKILAEAAKQAPQELQADCFKDARYADVCAVNFASVANQVRFLVLRDQLLTLKPDDQAGRSAIRDQMLTIIADERVQARRLYALDREDSRIGFESTNHYWFVPLDVAEKLVNLRWIEKELSAL